MENYLCIEGLLDKKGWIELIELTGDDDRIAHIAKISTMTQEKETDIEKLIDNLVRLGHWSCFEFCNMIVKVYCPMFVRSQWHRHRAFSYMEQSRRYTKTPVEVYVPVDLSINADRYYRNYADISTGVYETLLTLGLKPEQARGILPVASYTTFYAAGNLRNWIHFLRQRLDKAAQMEIRVYAEAIWESFLKPAFPFTAKAVEKYIFNLEKDE